jgi:cytoskeletal protein RodZ
MSEESNGASEGRENKPASGNEGVAIGRTLKEARQTANIDANKLCSDLRIAPQALEALEQGNYHLLPGDPYIRALLGSIGRYLNLDPLVLVQRYNKEIGAVAAAPSIAPYKDRTQTHTAAHKQIFFVIFAVLFIVLFLLFRKLNVEDGDAAKILPPPTTAADALSPAAPDTLLESKSLAPDTALAKASPDSGEIRGANPLRPPLAAPARPGAPLAAEPSPSVPGAAPVPAVPVAPVIDSSQLTLAVVKPLIDSVGVKVMRSGKEDFATMLRLGKQMQVSHTDTIVIAISKRKSVEVTLDGKTVIPERKRFKIYGTTLKTF